MGLATDLEPTKRELGESGNKRYTYDPKTGDKVRLKPNSPKKSGQSKAVRRQERSIAFWDKL